MTDHSNMKLGMLHSGETPKVMRLSRYESTNPLPMPPEVVNWDDQIPWTMLANDRLGLCVLAGILHYCQAIERWKDGSARVPTDEEAITAYELMGYNPAEPSTDNGVMIYSALTHWRDNGFTTPAGLDKIDAFVRVNPLNLLQVKQALWLFGPLILGLALPLSAQSQPVWTNPPNMNNDNAIGSWGGHCVILVKLDDTHATVITWGEEKLIELGWFTQYCDEVWAVIHSNWLANDLAPNGFHADFIRADSKFYM